MSSPPTPYTISLQNLGLGYAIVIAFAFLILLSTLLLSSYLCFRRRHNFNPPPPNNNITIIPRIIFVSENDNDNTGVIGLDRSVINSYPKLQYHKKNVETTNNNGNNNVCSICLCEYKEGEMLRMMPDCNHYFHLCCLDVWLKLNGSCPVCRNSPLPTPISTPLAEVVPLSHYPDNRRRDTVISSS